MELAQLIYAYFSYVVAAVTFQRCSDQKKGVGVLTLQQLYFAAIMLLLLKYDHPSPTLPEVPSSTLLKIPNIHSLLFILSGLSSAPPSEFLQPWLP